MAAEPLYLVPPYVQTRWASPENPTAERGRACLGNDGRKRRSCFPIKAGESATLLDLRGTSGTVRRIWITINDRSPRMLRGLHDKYHYCFYRLHVPDPIWFQQCTRVTIQQIGCWDPNTLPQMAGTGVPLVHGNAAVDVVARLKDRGYGLFERQDDWSSCAWFYLGQPANSLPALPSAAERVAGLA